MVASLVGVLLAPTYSPTETSRAVTMPSNGAEHLGVTVIDLGDFGVGLRLLNIGLVAVALGQRLVIVCLGRNLPLDQIGLSLNSASSIQKLRLGGIHRSDSLFNFAL